MLETRRKIEQALLAGDWVGSIQLTDEVQKRLFAFILHSENRETSNFDEGYINNLKAVYHGEQVVDLSLKGEEEEAEAKGGHWRLKRIEAQGFGGVNDHGGEPFILDIDGENYCFEGYNDKGKTSLASTVVWAFTGHRLRSQEGPDETVSVPKPVFNPKDKSKYRRDWPPIAAYPKDQATMETANPFVRVQLTLENRDGATATITREIGENGHRYSEDPSLCTLGIPDWMIEIAVLMPNRIPHIKVGEDQDAVAALVKVIGLEPLGQLGNHVGALCDARKNFAKWPSSSDVDKARNEFEMAVGEAQEKIRDQEGAPDISKMLEKVAPDQLETSCRELSQDLTRRSADLLTQVSAEISDDLDINRSADQKRLEQAVAHLEATIDGSKLPDLPSIRFMDNLRAAAKANSIQTLRETLKQVLQNLERALDVRNRKIADIRLQLKAAAAEWHKSHHGEAVSVDQCPLCARNFDTNDLKALGAEIQKLKSEAEFVRKTFKEVCDELWIRLENAIPVTLKGATGVPDDGDLKNWLFEDLKAWLEGDKNLTAALPKARDRALAAWNSKASDVPECSAPPLDSRLGDDLPNEAADLRALCLKVCAFLHWEKWWQRGRAPVIKAWGQVAGLPQQDGSYPAGTLRAALAAVSAAVTAARPFEQAATALDRATKKAKQWHFLNTERQIRQTIKEALEPLKGLRAYVMQKTRETLSEVSSQTEEIFNNIYYSSTLAFDEARIGQNRSLSVTGLVSDAALIDATLVASTSWLRTFLWAFVLAVRKNAIRQHGFNVFPLFVLDDPQITFDSTHIRGWARRYTKMATAGNDSATQAQFFITSADTRFLDLLKTHDFPGRRASVEGIDPFSGRLVIVEGDRLHRKWAKFDAVPAEESAQDYIAALREHLEGQLLIMLHSLGVRPKDKSFGRMLYEFDARKIVPPFNLPSVRNMIAQLRQLKAFLGMLHDSHHDESRRKLGQADAKHAHTIWERLEKVVNEAFSEIREHVSLGPQPGSKTKLGEVEAPSATVVQLPKPTITPGVLSEIGLAAAQDEGEVTGDSRERSEPVVVLDQDRYRLLALNVDWLGLTCLPGQTVVVDTEDSGQVDDPVVVLHGETAFPGRLIECNDLPGLTILSGERGASADPPKVRRFVTADIERYRIRGVLFDRLQGQGPAFAIESSPTLEEYRELVEVTGDSAVPILKQGDRVLVSPKIEGTGSLDQYYQHIVAVELNDGRRLIKRLGARGDSEGKIRVLDNVGLIGETLIVRFSDDVSDAFQDKPLVVELRDVRGFWFA